MSILYAMVSRGEVVLSEFNATATKTGSIARQIMEKVPGKDDDCHVSYAQDRYMFHVRRTDSVTTLCMADETAGRRVPFAFLEDIHLRFVRTYGRAIRSAQPYAMNDEFSRVLNQEMETYSNNLNADRINRLKGEMSQLLVDKTANMQGNTFRFRKQAHRFRTNAWWSNIKLWITLIIVILVILYGVTAFVCHGLTLPSCLK
uniref:Longin domain-containing protein n=1 Tax=Kalanchoe fedtschenkoi TaxID=63787 RepID=A0A7N0UU47_KALFE